MEKDRQRPVKPRRRLRYIALGLAALPVLGLLVFWQRIATDVPDIQIPTPIMPNPNACDYYVAAGSAMVKSKIVDYDGSKLQIAVPSLAQKKSILVQNCGVFRSLHEGFAYPFVSPPSRSFYAPVPQYPIFQGMARLLAFQGRTRAQGGDWGGAAESGLDGIRLGEDVPHGDSLLGDLVGIACQAIGRKHLWVVANHLDAAEARSAALRLETIMTGHFAFADTLQEEKRMVQGGLKKMFRTITPRTALQSADAFLDKGTSYRQRVSTAMLLLSSKRRIIKDYSDYMDQMSARARLPYAVKAPTPSIPSDAVNQMINPVLAQFGFKDTITTAQNGLLLITFALRAYRLEHGAYPQSLSQIAPDYLHRLPDDPFALTGTFHYRLAGNSYVLYSLGPDGKDDGGQPADDTKMISVSNPRRRYLVNSESLGDIVAGVNTQ